MAGAPGRWSRKDRSGSRFVAIAPGGDLPAHRTGGPVTIHVFEGEVTVRALNQEYPLAPNDVLVLAPGVEHAARSAAGGVFLLTVVHPDLDPPSGGGMSQRLEPK
jgi:quercetin dioxygenase-like cupin family protein